uniref:Uncharacterized protein n=1 Tax=Anguilla anguilla TaxID=7936 RepID=A0A0E9X942_ANGAN
MLFDIHADVCKVCKKQTKKQHCLFHAILIMYKFKGKAIKPLAHGTNYHDNESKEHVQTQSKTGTYVQTPYFTVGPDVP